MYAVECQLASHIYLRCSSLSVSAVMEVGWGWVGWCLAELANVDVAYSSKCGSCVVVHMLQGHMAHTFLVLGGEVVGCLGVGVACCCSF